jgi:energy-coupling factor transport system ATP-binding protein
MVGLEHLTTRHPYDLSMADRKRLAFAGVLAMDTPIIILDEPTTGQDFPGIELIGNLVDNLHSMGKTIIAVTHDIDFCAEHFDRTLVMAKGSILVDGPTRWVMSQSDALVQTGVQPPQMVRLAARLGWEETPLSVNEFIDLRYPPKKLDSSDPLV